jgi:hypothetical protein
MKDFYFSTKPIRLLAFFILSIFSLTCSIKTKDEIDLSQKSVEINYKIDTINIKQIELKQIYFRIEQSSYPQLIGTFDEIFRKQINDIFFTNFDKFLINAKSIFGRTPTSNQIDESSYYNIPASAVGSFEILTSNDSIVSIIQYFVALVGGGGNAWEPSSTVINIDLKNRIILNNIALSMNYYKKNQINLRIKQFFDERFPLEAENNELSYPFIDDKSEFEYLEFGIRNDSIMLVTEAYPSAHSSYQTYIIPIEKWNR